MECDFCHELPATRWGWVPLCDGCHEWLTQPEPEGEEGE